MNKHGAPLTHTHIHIYIYMYIISLSLYIYIYIHTNIYIDVYIYIYMYVKWRSSHAADAALRPPPRPGAPKAYSTCSWMSCARFGTHILWRCVPKHARLHFARGVRGFVSQEKKQTKRPIFPGVFSGGVFLFPGHRYGRWQLDFQ